MATRVARTPATVISGDVRTPDVRFAAFIMPSKYHLVCDITSLADLSDSSKSLSIFIEVLNESTGLWEVMGGTHWRGGTGVEKDGITPRPAPANFRMQTWRLAGDGTLIDMLANKRVRLWATSPAIEPDSGDLLYPGTTGPVTVRLSLADERAS